MHKKTIKDDKKNLKLFDPMKPSPNLKTLVFARQE
jgi:hypothetical protein